MNVVGLDPSLSGTGVAEHDGTTTTLRPPMGPDEPCARLKWISKEIIQRAWIPTDLGWDRALVAIEGFSYASKGRGLLDLAGLGWLIRVELHSHTIPYAEIAPSTLKKYATGSGNASKAEVLVAAVQRLGYTGASTDEADAAFLRAAALDHYTGGEVCHVPKKNRAALDVVNWPALPGVAA